MKKIKSSCNTQSELSACINIIRKAYNNKKCKIEMIIRNKETAAKIRENAKNALMWHWINEICKQRSEYQPNELHCLNKLEIGVPILMQDGSFSSGWDCIKNLKYEIQIKFMDKSNKFYVPITSVMTEEQMIMYLNRMKQVWERNGCHLTDKDDLYQKAMGRRKQT